MKIGDVFSVHAVDNPSFESELELLRNFGPSLQTETLRSLVQAFSQLRSMADQGQLNYPYSTREVINVVKHLEVLNKVFSKILILLKHLASFELVALS